MAESCYVDKSVSGNDFHLSMADGPGRPRAVRIGEKWGYR
jgi:hypothetical protein